MKHTSFNFFLAFFLLLGLTVCLISACTIDDEEIPEDFDQEVILRMTQNGWPTLAYDRIFVSNKNGELLDCRYNFWPQGVPTEFVNEIPLKDDFMDLTFSDYPVIDLDKYRLYTYANIKRKDWTTHKIKRAAGFVGGNTRFPVFWKPDPSISPETYFIYNACSRNNVNFYEWLLLDDPFLQADIYCDNLFVLAYEPNGEISYKLFPEVRLNDSIPLDFNTYTALPIAELTTAVAGDIRAKKITGLSEANDIVKSASYYDPGFYSNFTTIPYGDLNDGKIIFPENTFEEFLVDLEITSPTNEYYLKHQGDPIYEYSPTAPKFTMEGSDVNSFVVNPNGENADFYGVTWEVKNSDFDIEWTVYHDKDHTEKLTLPEMPECIIQIQTRLSRSDFKLKSIESYNYENFNSLEDYINNRFDPETGLEGFELRVKGGRYEKKVIKF